MTIADTRETRAVIWISAMHSQFLSVVDNKGENKSAERFCMGC
jgi:hypothetical protein